MTTKVPIEDLLRLSPIQKSLLAHTIASGSKHTGVRQKAYRWQGNLHPGLFQQAWKFLVLHTAILRSSVPWEGLDKPVQVVHKQLELPLVEHDWSHIPSYEQQPTFMALCKSEREEGFDVEEPPLLRLVRVQTGATEHLLLWTFHGFVADAMSIDLVMQEVGRIYHGLVRGEEPGLPKLEKFKVYASWAFSQDSDGSDDFWRSGLQGSAAPEDPGSAETDEAFEVLRVEISEPHIQEVLSQSDQNYFRAVVHAAWCIVMAKYFGQGNLLFGVNFSGRYKSLKSAETICGPLENILPFRTALPTDISISAWLEQLQKQYRAMTQHAYCGLDKVTALAGSPSNQPLFNTAVLVSNGLFHASIEIGEQTVIDEIPLPPVPECPLTLQAAKTKEGVTFELAHLRHLESDVMHRLAESFSHWFKQIVTDPDQLLAKIMVLSESERSQLLAWSSSGESVVPDQCIHHLFEVRAKENPEAIAAIYEEGSICYGELNVCANQLARHLRQNGVGAEEVVGVFMARSRETLIAILGILKAGAAYLPLDAELPPERLSYFIQDAQVRFLLTKQDLLFELPLAAAATKVICLDTDWDEINSYLAEGLPLKVEPERIGYVIYTSGSTGKPKGVAVTHDQAAAHLSAVGKEFAYVAQDRVLQFASLSFDVSVEQLLAPLAAGATVVLKGNNPWDRKELFAAVQRFGVTVINVPPAYFAQLTEDEETRAPIPPSLRLVIVGGDAMSPEVVRRWCRSLPRPVELLNAYGPTEAVITATLFQISGDSLEANDVHRIPIGHPLAGRKAYVLDNRFDLAPIGVWGELYLGGTLARGYLNHADLTAEKFVPDPISSSPGTRLYCTGDRVRCRADGNLEFRGRTDNQVKIRGFRIELEEIELALAECPGVKQVAVAAQPSTQGEKRLVAFVVGASGSRPEASELRDALRKKLPDYMVPSHIDFVDALPLTASGKIDRNLLPAFDTANQAAQDGSAPEATATEKKLKEIWADVLGIAQMDVHDDFFDLGGDSLLATQVMTRVQKAFGVEVPLRIMFDTPTIANLAQAIGEQDKVSAPQMELRRTDREGDLQLSPAQERLWFLSLAGGQSSLYNMTGAVRMEGSLEIGKLEEALTEVIRRHEALRTIFPLKGDYPVQVVQREYPVRLALVDLSHLPEEKREAELSSCIRAEASLSFDLFHGPVFRARLVRLTGEDHVLLATIHHIACDGWSLAILANEVTLLYGSLLQGKSSPLPDLPLQYVDVAHWQRQLLEQNYDSHLDYWRRRLGGSPPPPALPQEKTAHGETGFRGANYKEYLSSETTDGIHGLCKSAGVSVFMVLLAAWKALICAYTDSKDIVVGTDVANRNHEETEKIIGFFVNILALRTDLGGNPSFLEVLDRVRETTLGAYQHQDMPFDRIVDELNPNRTTSLTPLFKTYFIMPRAALELLQLRGLRISRLELEEQTAKFDLIVLAEEAGSEIVCNFNYKTDLFEPDAIHSIAEDFKAVLEHFIAKPDTRITTAQSIIERDRPKTRSFKASVGRA
jgi:amino acid adenylation domain-containing protein